MHHFRRRLFEDPIEDESSRVMIKVLSNLIYLA
ncbi:hypothetical protein FHX76_002688 [Lysinibacter cavernae]|uniref:Uncharacterized protein n=1 Tax=Lysinibacter cavernae TaxID=1640652 RepID=A0A7X5R3D7_9MICO|nr:hypothetical protein [Lysinibacter cavernae]